MKAYIEERALKLANYIVENNDTIRNTASKFGISKSTVFNDVSFRLEKIDLALHRKVNEVLQTNKSERHIRGGEATKTKYLGGHYKGY